MFSRNILVVLAIVAFILTDTVAGGGFFSIQRIPSSCIETTLNYSADSTVSNNCLTYSWEEINNLTTNYTTYIDPATSQTFYAKIAALTVLGTVDNYSLNYQCPPTGYNGVGPGCSTNSNTQLVVLYVNAIDGKLYGIDIILSGFPFPSSQSLQENQPPFGKATLTFTGGVPLQSTGYLRICKNQTSRLCPNQNYSSYKLPHPLPSNYGYGIFGIQAFNFVTNSTWIMDDKNQLLIVTAGTTYYYFNATGFFMYDSVAKTCTWSPTCNYVCEAYNYDSRFLDYAGEWIITKKWGIPQMQPLTTQIWIGNAIDAAGIFPIIMYTDKRTGHYLGLDKLDPIPMAKMGATYWYTEHGDTTPRVSIEDFHPNVVEGSCVGRLNIWTGLQNNSGITLNLVDIRIISFIFFLQIFQLWMFTSSGHSKD